MNLQNIISAGKMIAIVVALLGAVFCGMALTPFAGAEVAITVEGVVSEEAPAVADGVGAADISGGESGSGGSSAFSDLLGALCNPGPDMPTIFGLTPLHYLIFGAVLMVCGLVLLTTFGRARRRPALANVVLVFGTIVGVLGLVAIATLYRNPFSWMIAIVGVAIFIDALCLKISLLQAGSGR